MAKQFVIQEYVIRDDRGKKTHRDVVIPDDKWVVFASSHLSEERWYADDTCSPDEHSWREGTYTVIGDKPNIRYVLDSYSSRRHYSNGSHCSRSTSYYLVGDVPFGVILEKKEDGERDGGLWFSCARQVHKGELGRRPIITRPQFARETFESIPEISPITEKPIRPRDQKRGKVGWTRLREVAGIAGMKPEELVHRYFDFTDAERPRLCVLFAKDRTEIHCRPVPWRSWQEFSLENLPALFDRDPDTIWIRQGFALAVLYMHSLGYCPDLPEKTEV
ncbi:MAG: hypothetical protein ABIB04_01935 [Patescibacteria group bacterium]